MSAWETWRSRGDPSIVYEARPVTEGYEMRPPDGEVFVTVDARTLERLYERTSEHDGS